MPSLNVILQGGALLALSIAFLWMVRALLTEFRISSREQTRAININTAAVVAFQKQLLIHDMTVSGINPSLGPDVAARAAKAYSKYCEVAKSLDAITKALEVEIK